MNISPYFLEQLRKWFNEDIMMRKLATKTQITYIRGVNKLCEYLQHSVKTTTQEELREFQLFMVTSFRVLPSMPSLRHLSSSSR
ncbi:hypothetical protein H4J59_04080 [Colwellia sp. MB02u-10]|uniref:phage integrase N-terminal SAM-like domain-containing protein n=1 Tax=Colwellia sp. MB02u-10 TaxID=2759828 RepID=UPI0015F62453|nr:hypothetical protein [Colwellia sp. MB02u-10]MBA6340173.1 hypothetical protein [Colwellia sp. MB02u-10]